MSHGDSVVNGYRIELGSIAAQLLNLGLHNLTNLVQMGMAGHKLCKRIDNCYDGLAELLALHAVGHP